MNPDVFNYIVIISISGVLSLVLGAFAYAKRRAFSGSITLMFISVFSAIYTFGHAFELASNSLSEILFWIKFQYLGMPFISPSSLVLIMQYIGLEKYMTRKKLMILFAIPVCTFLMLLTNEYHHLFYQSYIFRQDTSALLVDFKIGLWYIIHGSYTFGCLLVAAILLLSHWKNAKSAYWKQLTTMLLGLLIPMIASFLYLIGKAPYGMDPVPIVMCLTSVLYIWAIFSNKMLVIAPIAKERVFESMRDGVLVLDLSNMIIDYNKAALRIFENLHHSSIGKELESVVGNELEGFSSSLWLDEEDYSEVLKRKSDSAYYQIYSSPVYKSNGQLAGRTVILSDITEEILLREQLKELAFKDGLTNIFNRKYVMEKGNELLNQSNLLNKPLSILLFDIDFFKSINDNYGHIVGDEAIRHIVSICNQHLKTEYLFARYGGEEFIICLPSVPLHEAVTFAETIRRDIENNELITENHVISITASFGVADRKEFFTSLEELIDEADQALYFAKKSGRNIVRSFNELACEEQEIILNT
ncbi:histidine kinase N-terminal 7TM domain-containing protein [Bacillus sp. CGMCC 1.16607]|uniref:histidine kinase N-terminal 7TM domain-containing diguanylate cyclase n=1 Tax=Bacillus sp. CGMCC 1.16607 TaxID=3351842 RepID=UPI003645B997